MMKTAFITLGMIIMSWVTLLGQAKDQAPENYITFGAQYGYQVPLSDLAERFGPNFAGTFSVDYYNRKLNGMLGLEWQIQFGNNVKEDVLAPLRIDQGVLLGTDGGIGDIFLRRRGLYIGAYINKIILKSKSMHSSGLALGVGAGVWQHFVRIQNDSDNIGQLRGDYAKGYDRLARGPALRESLSYLHLNPSNSVKYSIVLSFTQGFLNPVRGLNFDTQVAEQGRRLDLFISLDAKWYIPLAEGASRTKEEVFY